MELVSIIIPIYNSAQCICKCIESVLSQSYNKFELLLVDDGSLDDSYTICKKYASIDGRIKLFHQKNSGVSAARNLGLNNASGTWITFIDSDDWIDNNYLETLISNSNNVDCVVSNCIIHNKNGITPIVDEDSFYNTEKGIGQMLMKYMFIVGFWAPWAKLYKREIINSYNIRYNIKYSLGEDSLFFFEYLLKVNSILVSGTPHYHYIESESSLSNRKLTFEMINSTLTELLDKCDLLEKKYYFKLPKRKCDTIMYFLVRYDMSALSFKALYKDLKLFSKTSFFCYIVNDCEYVYKGRYRKFSDFCIKNRLLGILSLLYYFTKRFY